MTDTMQTDGARDERADAKAAAAAVGVEAADAKAAAEANAAKTAE